MKAQEFRVMEAAALEGEIEKRKRELLDLRFQVALGEEVHPHQIRQVKRDISRAMTVMNEKKSAATEASGSGDN